MLRSRRVRRAKKYVCVSTYTSLYEKLKIKLVPLHFV